MYINFVTKEDYKFFFPVQGKRGEQPFKGKKKPVSGDKGINIVAM